MTHPVLLTIQSLLAFLIPPTPHSIILHSRPSSSFTAFSHPFISFFSLSCTFLTHPVPSLLILHSIHSPSTQSTHPRFSVLISCILFGCPGLPLFILHTLHSSGTPPSSSCTTYSLLILDSFLFTHSALHSLTPLILDFCTHLKHSLWLSLTSFIYPAHSSLIQDFPYSSYSLLILDSSCVLPLY